MPGKDSAAKRHRQSEKRRFRNKFYRTQIKTASKKFVKLVSGSNREEAEVNYRSFTSLLDRAVVKGIFHKNTVARKKARMYALLRKMS